MNKKYYAFEYDDGTNTACADRPKRICGQGYIFGSREARDYWIAYSYSPTANGRLRKALVRDEARKDSRYGIFISVEEQ